MVEGTLPQDDCEPRASEQSHRREERQPVLPDELPTLTGAAGGEQA
jgi:hypothetical protein